MQSHLTFPHTAITAFTAFPKTTFLVLRLAQLLINNNTATKCLEGLLAWFVFRKKEKERRRRSEEHEYLLVLVFRVLTEPNSVKFLVLL